ncbi:MAG: hypothetical protein Q7T86_10270 [Hyphomicrobiaceae bacterium]|nr:hypothetical protein [Hyphomicrobiaceae bacterium]
MTARSSQTGRRQSTGKDDRRGATAIPPLDAEQIRNEIAARLMRLHCARQHGCTRRCRRLGRCVAADEVDALNSTDVVPSAKGKGAPGKP